MTPHEYGRKVMALKCCRAGEGFRWQVGMPYEQPHLRQLRFVYDYQHEGIVVPGNATFRPDHPAAEGFLRRMVLRILDRIRVLVRTKPPAVAAEIWCGADAKVRAVLDHGRADLYWQRLCDLLFKLAEIEDQAQPSAHTPP